MTDSPRGHGAGSTGEGVQDVHRFSHRAMATVFEIAVVHGDSRYSEQGAHEAFRELDRLEQELSRFIDNSDVSRINAAGTGSPVIVGEDTLRCLTECARLTGDTAGAFDPAFRSSPRIGMDLLDIDPGRHSVTKRVSGVTLDLGGFGKGYAVDVMAGVLREWGLGSAILHGGASSALALAAPANARGWEVTMSHPLDAERVVERLWLTNRAVSGSGIRKGGHIVDPRTGRAAAAALAAWVLEKSAATADALSTAFMVMSPEEISTCCEDRPGIRALVILDDPEEGTDVLRFGDDAPPA